MADDISALPKDALVTILLAVPVDTRARCAVLSRHFRDVQRHGESAAALRARLDFTGCAVEISGATLRALVLRGGDALRAVNINAPCCEGIGLKAALGALSALRPSAVEELDLREPLQEIIFDSMVRCSRALDIGACG